MTDAIVRRTESAVSYGIGIQYHIFALEETFKNRGYIQEYLDPRIQFEILERLNSYGKPMNISEITIPSLFEPDPENEAIQAEILEKLYTLWNNKADTNRYSIVRSNDKLNIHHSATEIQDNNTTFVLSRNLDLDSHQGLMIDVIPLDNVAPSKFGKISQMINSMIYCCFNFQRMPQHKGGLTALATKIALTLIPSFKLS